MEHFFQGQEFKHTIVKTRENNGPDVWVATYNASTDKLEYDDMSFATFNSFAITHLRRCAPPTRTTFTENALKSVKVKVGMKWVSVGVYRVERLELERRLRDDLEKLEIEGFLGAH